LKLRHTAELAPRRGVGFVDAHAGDEVALRLLLNVRAHFLGHLAVEPLSAEKGDYSVQRIHLKILNC
jgi:hypothetical protein